MLQKTKTSCWCCSRDVPQCWSPCIILLWYFLSVRLGLWSLCENPSILTAFTPKGNLRLASVIRSRRCCRQSVFLALH